MTFTRKIPWRKWLRALHRDAGYLAVGLTFVYALSGIAVNHLQDWDPNFQNYEKTSALPPSVVDQLPKSEMDDVTSREAAQKVLRALGRPDTFDDVYSIEAGKLEITVGGDTLFVDLRSGQLREAGQKPRVLLRAANWLHLNRGKRAWTLIADGYAGFLLFLATSGLFMLPGRRGFWGRGGLLAIVGAAVPVVYVVLSGGP